MFIINDYFRTNDDLYGVRMTEKRKMFTNPDPQDTFCELINHCSLYKHALLLTIIESTLLKSSVCGFDTNII